MYKKDVRLFGKALVEGLSIKFEQELANSTESVLCSEEHKAAMLEIIATGKAIEQRMGKKKLIAILVAAALLLLAGCTAYVYRNEIGSFIETFYEEYVNVDFVNDDKNTVSTIEEVYELTYIPEGYVLADRAVSDASVSTIYYDESGNLIMLDQCPLGASNNIIIDNDTDNVAVIDHNGTEIYVRATEKTTTYIWLDEKYLLTIICSNELIENEVLKTIEGIK